MTALAAFGGATPTTRRTTRSYDNAGVAIGAALAVAYLLATAIGVAGAMTPLTLLTLVISVVMPSAGVAVLALLIPLREPGVFGYLGLFIPLVGATILGLILRVPFERPRRGVDVGTILLIGYLAVIAISLPPMLAGSSNDEAKTAIARALQVGAGAGVFLAARAVFARVDWRPYLALVLVGAGIAATIGIATALVGPGLSGPIRALATQAPAEQWTSRALGTFTNTNYFGFYLAMAFVIGVGSIRLAPRPLVPLVFVVIGLTAIAMVLTYSRAALLAAVVGVVVYAILRDRRLGIPLVAATIVGVAIIYPVFLSARLDQSFGSTSALAYQAEDASTASRAHIIETGIRLWQREPVFGIGFGLFQFESPRYQGASPIAFAHNWYVEVLAEQGIVGTALVAGIGATLFVGLWRSRHPMRDTAIAVLVACLIGFIAVEGPTLLQATGIAWLVFAMPLSARRDRPRPAVSPRVARRGSVAAPTVA